MKTDFILTAEGVNKSFDGFKAIHDLNFYLDKGELRTIIGPNGAGKSTFLDLITGRYAARFGEHRIWWHAGNQTARVRDLQTRNRPQISNSKRLFRPHRLRKHSPRSRRQPWGLELHFRTGQPSPTRAYLRGARDHRVKRSSRNKGGKSRSRPEAVARDRYAACPKCSASSGG